MTDSPDRSESWDFYFCRVDGRAASIFLDLAIGERAPIEGAGTLYWVDVAMLDPAEHGMGGPDEVEQSGDAIDALAAAAHHLDLIYVGRLRNHGLWQLRFYGPPERAEPLREACDRLPELSEHRVDLGATPDPAWDYYFDFLFPSAERQRWMADRAVVEALEDRGDDGSIPRRVDHWAYFPTARARDDFAAAAASERFTVEELSEHPDAPELRFGAQLHRVDRIELEHIHAVVMRLVELAGAHGGDYDGWETSVEKPELH